MTTAIAVQSAGRGLEEVKPDQLTLPHLLLLQSLTKFVSQDGLPAGIYINTLSKQQYKDGVTIIPFKMTSYTKLLRPKGDKMEIEGRAQEGDPRLVGRRFFAEKTADGGKLKANAEQVIVVMASVEGKPVIVNFSKTSYRCGKELLTLAKMNGGDFWSHKYTLTPKKVTGEFTYYISSVTDAGITTDTERQETEALYNAFAAKAQQVVAKSDPEVGDAQEEEVGF